MKADLTNIKRNGLTGYRKEHGFIKQFTLYDLDKSPPAEVICLRIYRTSSRHYACVWVHGWNGGYGGGWAGGGGYHKSSAAAAKAIEAAGIKLSEDIAGRGDSYIRKALEAIADALYVSKYFIGEANP